MTQLIYNGKDISDAVDIKECYLNDCVVGCADDASIVFPDGDKIWDKWNPKRGDTAVIKSNDYSTGLMYVDRVSQLSGIYTINTISTPLTLKKQRCQIWRNIKLSEIISDISKSNGFKTETYGISDYSYAALSQINQSDLDFLNNLCIREGYCCKVTDGKLIVFAEKYIETKSSTVTITIDDVFPLYDFSVSEVVLNNFTVQYSAPFKNLISYTAFDDGVLGGSDKKVEFLSTISEAERWSKGYLRYKNKYQITAYLPMKSNTSIAAGSVVNIEGFGSFDGKYFIYKVSQDTVNSKSYLYLRKIVLKY